MTPNQYALLEPWLKVHNRWNTRPQNSAEDEDAGHIELVFELCGEDRKLANHDVEVWYGLETGIQNALY